jgi:hypothetical protein
MHPTRTINTFILIGHGTMSPGAGGREVHDYVVDEGGPRRGVGRCASALGRVWWRDEPAEKRVARPGTVAPLRENTNNGRSRKASCRRLQTHLNAG